MPFPAGSYPAKVVADGAVAYWRLGEASGTTANDSVGTAHGTISGGVTLGQAGALADGNKAMAFPGSAWIDTPAIAISAAFTLEFWIKVASLRIDRIISNRPPTTAGQWSVEGDNGRLFMFMHGPNDAGPETTITVGTWHHVVFVNSGTNQTVYRDGVSASTGARSHAATAASPIRIGGDAVSTGDFIGTLDDVAIYPTALTAPQIAAHYAARTWANLLPMIPWAVVGGAVPGFAAARG